ncbi:MAG TPA: PrsW family glutamic-type intramembrane protease [Streptosporangiaceae bacterium]|nr:PrsW family glutamic-type intramembrane protease [Streptosporangiaceae bacterium]
MPAASDLLPLGDWVRHNSLRSWPVLLFLALICVPSFALVLLGLSARTQTFDGVAWIFAAYFALAWLLLLGVIVRPEHVTRTMLALIIVTAIITEIPLAVALETALHDSNANLASSIATIGLPEELAKALPIVIVALIYRRSHSLTPKDYLFLGAVSGLAFGASEVVRYFTINGVEQFYLTVHAALPTIEHLIRTGNSATASLFSALIGPVLEFILNFVWRFLTDPISHACWSGLTGYFIGLAVTSRHKWYAVGWIGLAAAAILHGLNDWSQVNGHVVWILVTFVSGVLFLGYAKVGSRVEDGGLPDTEPPPFLDTAAAHARHSARQTAPAAPVAAAPTTSGNGRPRLPWWEQH